MKKIYSLFLIVLIFLSACSEDEVINDQINTDDDGVIYDPIIPETTKTISSEEWSSSVSEIDTVKQTMKLKTSANDLLQLNEGDIIVNENDGGYLLKIESIEQQGDELLLSTSEASLEEAIEEADFWYDTPLENANVSEVEMLTEGSQLIFSDTKSNSTKKGLSFTIDAEIKDDKDILSIDFNGSVSLLSDIRTKLKIKRFQLRNFEIGYDGKIITELTAEIKIKAEKDSAKVSKKDLTKDIANVKFKKIVVWCGSCPILVEPVLQISIGARLSAAASASIGVSDTLAFGAGIRYERGDGWDKYGHFDHGFTLLRPSGEIEVKAECFVTAKLKYKIYKKLSPYIEFPIYGGVRAGVNTSTGFYYDLYGGVSMSAGAKMTIFGKNLINYNIELFTIEEYINQAPEKPYDPTPANEEDIDYNESIKLMWEGKDYNKEDALTYTVYASKEKSKVMENEKIKNTKKTYYDLTDASSDQTIYWKVIAKDSKGKQTSGPIWSFKVGTAKIAPSIPELIAPLSNQKGIDPNSLDFEWKTDDKDETKPEFTILIGTSESNLQSVFKGKIAKANGVFNYSSASNLKANTNYFWQVISMNDGLSEKSDIATFTTSIAGAISFTDTRDSKEYLAVKIGDDYWMAENLAYFQTNSTNYSKIGNEVFYKSTIITTACPAGWHIPTIAEYETLCATIDLENKGTYSLLNPSSFSNGTNSTGFNALSTGTNINGSVEGKEAAFYLLDPNSQADDWPVFMYLDDQVSYWDNSDPDSKLTIRCVKNK